MFFLCYRMQRYENPRNVIQSEAKNLDNIYFMLPSSFLPSVVWMTIDKNYGTIENICWRINTNSLSLHQRKEKELITNIKTDKIMKKYVCTVCNWIYDPAVGDPDGGIAPGTPFEAIPDDWACPLCGVTKEDFELVEE